MKVLALVSGGKDSCYNALLCQERYGHEIVALGNLHPSDPTTEELDSYMYQTVGHTLIASYAECTGLPLFRKKICGTSVEQGLVYEEKCMENDEVEDLAMLLAYAVHVMPEIEAVSSGAIASDYQRHRVERICSRLGLVSLAYMWHRPQSLLLKEMVDARIDARLIKIAAAGLDPSKHLGKSIGEMSPYLHRLRDMYGINVCGEGGEYETLTLDCPLFVHGRIVIDTWEVEIASNDSLAPVAWMRPTTFHVERKSTGNTETTCCGRVFDVPDGWREEKEDPLQQQQEEEEEEGLLETCDIQEDGMIVSESGMMVHGGYMSFHGYCRLSRSPEEDKLSLEEVSVAFKKLLESLQDAMRDESISFSSGIYTTLFVDDMSHFGHLNAIYSQYFPPINPPSRATLELAGQSRTCIAIQILCASRTMEECQLEKRVLHVQSMSEWAPCCIGPYSQATSYDGLVRFAGQIALDPATCTIPEGMNLHDQMKRVSQTCDLVGAAMKIDFKQTMLWSNVFVSDAAVDEMHLNGFDRRVLLNILEIPIDSGDDDQEYTEEYLMATSTRLPHVTLPIKSMILVIQCPRLPRDAKIEIQSVNIDIHELVSLSEYRSESESEDSESEYASRKRPSWLSHLQYRKMASSQHCLVSKGNFMKLTMTLSTSNNSYASISSAISEAITACQEDSNLSAHDIVEITAFISTAVLSNNQHDYEEIEAAICKGCQHASVFTVPVTDLWIADDEESQGSPVGLHILWKATQDI